MYNSPFVCCEWNEGVIELEGGEEAREMVIEVPGNLANGEEIRERNRGRGRGRGRGRRGRRGIII